MKTKNILTLMLLIWMFMACSEIEVDEFSYNQSFIKKVKMYKRIIDKDHTSLVDLTVKSVVDTLAHTVEVIVKTEADLTKLYAIVTLYNGCTIKPDENSSRFGTVADFSKVNNYFVKSNSGKIVKWKVVVKK